MKVFLSIILDRDGNIKENLLETNSLIEMDEILYKYKNSNEIRDKYQNIIEEFLLDNRNYIKKLNDKQIKLGKKARNNNGRIGICFYGKGNILRFVPIIYNDYELLKDKDCYKNIKSNLENIENLKELYLYKKYLLSNYEIDSIRYYLNNKNKKYLDSFINSFINRLKALDEEKRYYYFRSIMNICLLSKKKFILEKGKVDNIDFDVIGNSGSINNNNYTYNCNDDYFINLLDKGNYEDLFKYYDLDTINNYSENKDEIIGSRRK